MLPGGTSSAPFARGNDDGNDRASSFGDFDATADDGDGGAGFEMNDDYHGDDDGGGGDPTTRTSDDARCDDEEEEEDMPPPPPRTGEEEDGPTTRPKKKSGPKDPWAALDPHEPSNDKARPIRVGVTYVLPPGVDGDDRPSASVNGSRTRTRASSGRRRKEGGDDDDDDDDDDAGRRSSSHRDPRRSRPYLADVTFDETMMDEGGEGGGAGRLPRPITSLPKSGGLIFGDEFAHVARAHARHRDAARRRRRQRLLEEGEGDGGRDQADIMVGTNDDVLDHDDDDENDDYGGVDYGGYDDDDYGAGRTDADDPNDGGSNNGGPIHRSNVDFGAIGDVFARAGGDGGGFADDRDGGVGGRAANDGRKTFEELCRAHLRRFARSAEAFAAESHLTRRVGAWRAGLEPILEAHEGRPEFDIHASGRRILERVERGISARKRTHAGEKRLDASSSSSSSGGGGGRNNNAIGFSTIVARDCEVYEVCRLFLSTLMLCDRGNIAVHKAGDGDDAVELADSFDIELLNPTFQPPMESFFAPIDNNNMLRKENVESSNLGMIDESEIVFGE